MKKNAYTLAEVLICLGVIGVLAAIILPLANKYKPDPIKAMYIKTYDSIVETVNAMASNVAIYPITSNNYDYTKAPLYNTQTIEIAGSNYGGNSAKFCEIFALNFATTGNVSCSSTPITYSDDSSFSTPSFTTSQGIQFVISTSTDLATNYQTDIYFDVNGDEKGDNCIYNSETCKKPDRFKLIVSGDGHVIAADPIGEAYLKTRMNWRRVDFDSLSGSILSSVPDEWQVAPKLITEETKVKCPDGWGDADENGYCKIPNPLRDRCPDGYYRVDNLHCAPN